MNFKQNLSRYVAGLVIVLALVLVGSQYNNIKTGLSYVGEKANTLVAAVARSIVRPPIIVIDGGGAVNLASGSHSNSGENVSSNSGESNTFLREIYLGSNLNLYKIEIKNLSQLDLLYSRTRFLNLNEKTRFYSYSKELLLGGSKLDFYFDTKNIPGESVGIYNGKYLNTGFISKSKTCATKLSVKRNVLSAGKVSTPKVDSMTGICAPLTAAHSLNYTLKASSTKLSKATTTNRDGMIIWNKVYLEELLDDVGVNVGGGTKTAEIMDPNNNSFYDKYFPLVSKNRWYRTPSTGNKELDEIILKNYKKLRYKNFNFKDLIALYYKDKTDCSIVTITGGGLHISHISNIYIMNGKRYIEVTNTLEQGDENHNNITTNPGKTTFIVEDDGTLTVSHHSKEVGKIERAFWGSQNSDYLIDCVTPNK